MAANGEVEDERIKRKALEVSLQERMQQLEGLLEQAMDARERERKVTAEKTAQAIVEAEQPVLAAFPAIPLPGADDGRGSV